MAEFNNDLLINWETGEIDTAEVQRTAKARAQSAYGVDCTDRDIAYWHDKVTAMASMLSVRRRRELGLYDGEAATADFSIDPASTVDPLPACVEPITFDAAAVSFDVAAKIQGAEIIGHAHTIYFQHKRMSAISVSRELENIRDAMRELNNAFASLERAHGARTVGETASRIRAAAEAVR